MSDTITVDDLLRALEENPQWLEPLRAHYLARGDTKLPYLLERLLAERAALRAAATKAQ